MQLLRDRLDEYPEASGVEVATVDSFQGREADAVIISMVPRPHNFANKAHTYISFDLCR